MAMRYKATNYGMGQVKATATFEAFGDDEARAKAMKLLPGKHASTMGGSKGFVIGIRRLP